MDFGRFPLQQNPDLALDLPWKLDRSDRLFLIYIEGFFNDGTDFAFLVMGLKYITAFVGKTFSAVGYDGVTFATPIWSWKSSDLCAKVRGSVVSEKVGKRETKGLRWKYLFESGKKAWEKLKVDDEKPLLDDDKEHIDVEMEEVGTEEKEEEEEKDENEGDDDGYEGDDEKEGRRSWGWFEEQ
jgi:hypothetical protein